MSDLKKICEDLKTRSEMLAQASADHWSDVPSEVDKPVRSILLRGSEIMRGATNLGLSENPTALGILSRQLVELFISLQWVISDQERAIQYSEFSLNELDRLVQISIKDGLLSVKSRDDGYDVTEEFLSTRGKPKKGVSIEQQARESGVFSLYQMLYRFMSLDTHGKSETVVDPIKRAEVTLVHLQTIGAISQVLGHIAILWMLHRQKTTNEKIRELLGLNEKSHN